MIKFTSKKRKPQWLSIKSKITVCFLILVLLIAVFYGALHLIPIQNRSLSGKSPTDIENSIWISEELSYFEVEDSKNCNGVLIIDGVKVSTLYRFTNYNYVELYDNTVPKECRDLGYATCTCDGKTAKLEIHLNNGKKMQLTFKKQDQR